MAKRILLTLLLLTSVAGLSFAQTLKGTLLDENKEPMIGAAVTIKGTSLGGVTDLDGNFNINVGDKQPPFTIVASYVGYDPKELEVTSLTEKITLQLGTSATVMKELTVTERRLSEKQRESALTVESMDIIAIKETPAANFYDGLGSLKGVDLTAASIGFKIINTRGFNSTSPVRSLQLIDGVDNQAPGLNFSLGNFLGASELDILKVDMIQGASSAFYGPNAFNGVISMTTKDPFIKPGLSAMFKIGERNMLEGAIRWSQVFKNREGVDKFAYKLNFFYMQAYDWEADSDLPTPQSKVGKYNPGGYDAVNRYGDENLAGSGTSNDATSLTGQKQAPGLGIWHRDGYWEKDLVDYNSQNLKAGLTMSYRLKPDVELIAASSFGTGTTVYQGDNRYSLKGILFFQNRLEIRKKDKWFLRAYATHEDAGDSYDAVFTALLLQQNAKSDVEWGRSYYNFWTTDHFLVEGDNIRANVRNLPGFPPVATPFDSASANSVLALYYDSLILWHQQAHDYANSPDPVYGGGAYLEPGTAAFDSAFSSITSKTAFSQGGTRFYDKSALYHIHGEYKFTPKFMDIIVGGNARLYTPDSDGTIFSDTLFVSRIDSSEAFVFNDTTQTFDSTMQYMRYDTIFDRNVITNFEFGFYTGLEKKLLKDKIKLNLTARVDKNQNYDYLVSPAFSTVYSPNKNHTIRLSFSSAIRNPTLADQYLHYNVGRAILLGNVSGYDSLVTVESLYDYLEILDPDTLEYFNIPRIQPEKVKTVEIGYRATFFNRLFIDANYYYSWYTDFIGYKLGAEIEFFPDFPDFIKDAQVYRVAANADDQVTTQGFAIGGNLFFAKKYSLNGNYSWNKLDKRGSDDPIIPAFNTPEHKYNIGISGRDVRIKFGNLFSVGEIGFNINYKWVQGFEYEGSPQFTGPVPTYDMLDAQVNKKVSAWKTTFKLGASNLLNNKRYHVFGGPRVGRLAYFSILVDLTDN